MLLVIVIRVLIILIILLILIALIILIDHAHNTTTTTTTTTTANKTLSLSLLLVLCNDYHYYYYYYAIRTAAYRSGEGCRYSTVRARQHSPICLYDVQLIMLMNMLIQMIYCMYYHSVMKQMFFKSGVVFAPTTNQTLGKTRELANYCVFLLFQG